jgi:hypothetical protein
MFRRPVGVNAMKKGMTEQPGRTSRFAEEELRLRDATLSRTASDRDEERRSLDSVMVPQIGGMVSAEGDESSRIDEPSGADIDKETLAHRDATLRATPAASDPRRRQVGQITYPERGGMR